MRRVFGKGLLAMLLFSVLPNLGSGQASSEMDRWYETTISSLKGAGDGDSLLSAHLIALWKRDASAEQLLAQAYEHRSHNAPLLWYSSVQPRCSSTEPGGCEQSVRAAQLLTQADARNAMAWLTLAWAADRQRHAPGATHPDLIREGLRQAAIASAFHDYAFDLYKLFIVATGRTPLPKQGRGDFQNLSDEQTRVAMIMFLSLPGQEVMSWVSYGCHIDREPEADIVPLCKKASELFTRGDSMRTLSGDPSLAQSVGAGVARALQEGPSTPEKAKAVINAFAASASEKEFSESSALR